MAADEEFRKVAEDVRELARALRGELRTAKWEAKAAARDAKRDWREYRRWGVWPPPDWSHRWGPGGWTPPMGPWGPPQPPPPTGAATRPGDAGTITDPGPPGPAPTPPPGPDPGWAGHQWFPWGPHHGPPAMRPPTAPVAVRPPQPARTAPPPVRHKRDGSTLLSLLLVLVGLAWLGSASGIVSLSLETVLATVLVVLGAVMVITARTDWSLSRKHWPMWLGAVVLVLVMASANSGFASGFSTMHFGPTNATPTSWADVASPVTNFAGPIRVDLTQLPPNPPGGTITVRDVFGPISVTLPHAPSYRIHIKAHTSFGPVSLLGDRTHSGGVFTTKTTDVGPTNGPVLNLDLVDAFGPITVDQTLAP